MNSNAIAQHPASENVDEPLKGLAELMTLAFRGIDLTPLGFTLLERAGETPGPSSANALMDVATILHIKGNHEVAQHMQDQALQLRQLYQLPARKQPAIRLLAIYAPGDLNANTPLEFLAENSDIELNILYLTPGLPVPDDIPAHDILFVAIGESERNLELLQLVERVVSAWPCPVLNLPDKIARLARDTASELMRWAPGVAMPASLRIGREILDLVAREKQPVSYIQEGMEFPVIIRPVDSHAGSGLIKADDPAAISGYLQTMPQSEFFVSQFIDYRNEDGLFRKYRVALIDGQPYACHMAISEHWMVHYLSGGMAENAGKRAEEERFMADFDTDFASRHHAALRSIARRTELDYLVIDCAETQDGRLLVFEVDSSAVVHAMDPVEVFPYKKPQMDKVARAFRAMLLKAIAGGTIRT
jgi:glutathione synthase/RimK-type ligase-like ATP-grasp enzyme